MQPIQQVAVENSFGNRSRLLLRSAKRKRAYTRRRQQASLFARERELSPRNGHNEIQYIAKAPTEVHAMRCEQVDGHQLTDVSHN